MEILWLGTVLAVPLVFLPEDSVFSPFRVIKITLVHVSVSLIVGLWALRWARTQRRVSLPDNPVGNLFAVLQRKPSYWVYVSVAGYVGATVLAVITSLSFRTSLWGKFPGDEGYGLYNMMAYFVLFLAISANVRTPSQVWRLVKAIAIAGSVAGAYAALQRAGLDPFGWPVLSGRVVGTVGNPVFAGSLFVLTFPVTIALAIRSTLARSPIYASLWSMAALLQIVGLLLTESRGPLLGLAAGILAAIVLVIIDPGFKRHLNMNQRWIGLAAAGVLIAVLASGLVFSAAGQKAVAQFDIEKGTRSFDHLVNASIWNRIWIWEGSANLIIDRPAPAFYDDKLSFLRPLVGYGPDLFQFVFPLTAPPELELRLDQHITSAHNHVLHLWVETGFLGAAAYTLLIVAVTVVGVRTYRHRPGTSGVHRVLLAALVATVVGRSVDLLFGVATVSDQTVFWALLSLFVVLPIVAGEATRAPGDSVVPKIGSATSRTLAIHPWVSWGLGTAVTLLVVLVVWFHSVDYLRASGFASNSVDMANTGDLPSGLEQINRAIMLAPDVVAYRLQKATIYRLNVPLEPTVASQVSLARHALGFAKDATELQPFSPAAALEAANTASNLVDLGEVAAMQTHLRHLDLVANLRPRNAQAQELVASSLIRAGRQREAIAYATRGIEIADESSEETGTEMYRRAAAWIRVVRAIAYLGAGELERARTDARAAINFGEMDTRQIGVAQSVLDDVAARLADR